MKKFRILLVLSAASFPGAASAQNDYADAARHLDVMISEQYAYLDALPNGTVPKSETLISEREAVHDDRTLLAYAERRIASLADHHAITGSSFRDSWAVIPTYADLWIVKRGNQFFIDAVREESPAAKAGVVVGDSLVAVGGLPIAQAVSRFWEALGLSMTDARAEYAARVLAAGRRDRMREITVQSTSGRLRALALSSMYEQKDARAPVSVCDIEGYTIVRFNNSLDDFATVDAFDHTMRAVPEGNRLILDFRDTPSGGNTTVARGIMGWFVSEPFAYQVHNRPVEERQTGIPRQWIEQVLPRKGMHRSDLPVVLVGRWTGSMGEGIAVGFAAMGAGVQGTRMAGLKGSVEDLRVGTTDLFVKLPTERLLTVAGLPREEFVPMPIADELPLMGPC